jgi:hypothetical protein
MYKGIRKKKKKRKGFKKKIWVANWPQVTNKCYNIDITTLINAGTLVPRVANWPPKFNGILFSASGPIQGHKVHSSLGTCIY